MAAMASARCGHSNRRSTPRAWTFLTLMGFAGGLIMSAIKRDRGVKDYGAFIEGHGGMLDRIDSLCFAAPVFFHLTRFFTRSRTKSPR